MPNSEDEAEDLLKSPIAEKIYCGACKSAAVRKVVQCENCNKTMHKSCFEKYGCCKKKQQQVNENPTLETLTKENKILKDMINELESSLNSLKEKCVALEEENHNLKLAPSSNINITNFVTENNFKSELNKLYREISEMKARMPMDLSSQTEKPMYAEVTAVKQSVPRTSKNVYELIVNNKSTGTNKQVNDKIDNLPNPSPVTVTKTHLATAITQAEIQAKCDEIINLNKSDDQPSQHSVVKMTTFFGHMWSGTSYGELVTLLIRQLQ